MLKEVLSTNVNNGFALSTNVDNILAGIDSCQDIDV